MSGVTVAPAPDDIVASHAEAASNERPPLLVVEPLLRFLDEHGLGHGDLTAEPVGDGHSNVTYLVRRGDAEVVLRRPPRPPIPKSAHDVLREARLLRALGPTGARVPRVLAACDDEEVIGAPFYVMERIQGEVITKEIPAALDTPEQRRRIAHQLVDALVEIHAVDPAAHGLESFGKPSGYLGRQVKLFGALWEQHRTRDLPSVERVGAWLAEHMPEDEQAPTVVHGDFRLGNTMFATDAPARLIAVFDWEMATLGDPLADLGYLCALWTEAGDPDVGQFDLSPVTRREGFPAREELVARYEEGSGRTMTDLRWYTTLALWKSVVFMEGNYRRAVDGLTDDPFLKSFGEGVVELAGRAEAVAFGDA